MRIGEAQLRGAEVARIGGEQEQASGKATQLDLIIAAAKGGPALATREDANNVAASGTMTLFDRILAAATGGPDMATREQAANAVVKDDQGSGPERLDLQMILSQRAEGASQAADMSRKMDDAAHRVIGKIASLESERMLNPQPLPPRWVSDAIARPGSEVMLNPQPLPPRWIADAVRPNGDFSSLDLAMRPISDAPFKRLYEEVTLNPQPLPPEPPEHKLRLNLVAFQDVMLNPQPLPPEPPEQKPGLNTAPLRRVYEDVMLNPQPLPPEPPEQKLTSKVTTLVADSRLAETRQLSALSEALKSAG